MFPSTKIEAFLFLFFLLSYGYLASYIALNYRIVFDDRIPWDAYFSFDNRAIVLTGGGFERHPLSNYFFDWIRSLSEWISNGKKDAKFRLVLALCSTVMVSLSLIQVFKYLKNIINLPNTICFLIVAFFAVFTTPILLSFTPETYTYTFFLLILFNYYAASKIKKEKEISTTALVFASVAVGGLTITNLIKIYIPVLFEKQLFKNWKNFGKSIFKVLFSFLIFVILYLNRLNFDIGRIFNKTGEQYERFSKPRNTPIWDMIYSWFLGGNILFSNFIIRDYHSKNGFEYKALFMDVYSSWLPYFFIGLIYFLVGWSWIKNFKNKFAQILIISFLVDVLIHCILKFGLHSSYIYGAHFIYVVPLTLGWLFHAYQNSPKMLSFLMVLLALLFMYLSMNNFIRMVEFFAFLKKYYQ